MKTREKTIISTCKCGHTRTTIFPRGCSKHEEKRVRESAEKGLCIHCEEASKW